MVRLDRAIDRDGNLIESLLSATRSLKAAQRFFGGAQAMVGPVPLPFPVSVLTLPRAELTDFQTRDYSGLKQSL